MARPGAATKGLSLNDSNETTDLASDPEFQPIAVTLSTRLEKLRNEPN